MTSGPEWSKIINDWQKSAPWREQDHVLQDLVLSRLIVESSNDSQMRRRLVLHGGTCLHKIWHDTPQRYSEDLDFLCVKPWHLPFVMRRMKKLMHKAGLSGIRYNFWGYPSIVASGLGGYEMNLKVDFNPTMRASRRAFINRSSRGSLTVESDWYRGEAPHIPCASVTDILASKIAAVFDRSKPRDLADLCTGIAAGLTDKDKVAEAYIVRYRRGSHPASLSAHIDDLMSDDRYRQALSNSDFLPRIFDDRMRQSVIAAVDSAIAQQRRGR